jgi:putative ABC transport system substrate-binding protein
MERHGSRLSRRQFVVGAAGAGLLAGCGRLPGQAPPAPVARLGFLGPTVPQPYYPALEQALQELGYVEGRNFHIEWRYAGGSSARLAELAAELVQARVDIIVAGGNPAIHAAKQATNTIPIIMAVASSIESRQVVEKATVAALLLFVVSRLLFVGPPLVVC